LQVYFSCLLSFYWLDVFCSVEEDEKMPVLLLARYIQPLALISTEPTSGIDES